MGARKRTRATPARLGAWRLHMKELGVAAINSRLEPRTNADIPVQVTTLTLSGRLWREKQTQGQRQIK
jgi:hypothetical protein